MLSFVPLKEFAVPENCSMSFEAVTTEPESAIRFMYCLTKAFAVSRLTASDVSDFDQYVNTPGW
jgi:hypothetical protein